jgi:protein SCO1/2
MFRFEALPVFVFRLASFFLLACLTQASEAATLTGQIEAVDPIERTLRLSGVTYRVHPGDSHLYAAKDRISATASTSKGQPMLTEIWPSPSEAQQQLIHRSQQALRASVSEHKQPLSVGDPVPPFALWNQTGSLTTPASLKGQPYAVHFIFTRCQVTEMCPASTAKMFSVGQRLRDKDLPQVRLLTVTFDPAHDTPGVLGHYGQQRGLLAPQHLLLTGQSAMIHDLLKAFGVLTRHENGTITHTATTAVVGHTGELRYLSYGPDWPVDRLVYELVKASEEADQPPH